MPVEVAFVARGDAFIPFFRPARHEQALRGCLHHLRHRPVRGRPAREKGVMALTLDAALEAIADAGLKPADIDGVISWPGAVSRADGLAPSSPGSSGPGPHAVIDALRLNPTWYYGGPETPGMFAAVIHACMAVATGMCEHVLVYRALNEATVWRTVTERVNSRRRRRDRRDAVDAAVRRLLGPELDGALRHAAHARVRHDARAARGDRAERAPQRPAQPEGRAAGRPDDGRLPVLEDDQRPAVPVRLRHRGRRRDRPDRVDGRACRRRAEPADPLRGGRQRAWRPRLVGPVGGHDADAPRPAPARTCGRAPTSSRPTSTSRTSTTGSPS